MIYILDEWIIHDLQGDNKEDKQKESFRFLEKIKEECNKIVLVQKSKFMKKIWDFSKKASNSENIKLKQIFRFLKDSIIFNSEKGNHVDLQGIKSEHYAHILKDVNPDDHYLIFCYEYLKQEGEETVIITTDIKLKNTLEREGISIKSRDEFIKEHEILEN